MSALAARDVDPGAIWAFTDHRTLAQVDKTIGEHPMSDHYTSDNLVVGRVYPDNGADPGSMVDLFTKDGVIGRIVRPGAPLQGVEPTVEDPKPAEPKITWTRPERFIITRREAAQRARELIRAKDVPSTLSHADNKVTIERVVSAIRAGADLGMPPQEALDKIQRWGDPGRYCVRAEGGLALALRSGLVERIQRSINGVVIRDDGNDSAIDLLAEFKDDTVAEIRIWRRGQFDPYPGRYTVRDARRAKLWNNPRYPWWLTSPGRMLMWRATAAALHDGFADALGGLSIMEEMRDVATAAAPTAPAGDFDYLADAPEVAE